MSAYYNEIDPYAAQWLRNLIAAGHIAPGDVDERDIRDVRPGDLDGYTQRHFFAGIGGWSYALRLAGWPDDRPVWTGSCPCQPFSLAGKQRGFADERHLWPVWYRLIKERRPAKVFGEQVASAAEWLRLVRSDLEALGYAVGAMPVQAASAGADHLRDRYWFVAYAESERGDRREACAGASGRASSQDDSDVILADADDAGSQGRIILSECAGQRPARQDGVGDVGITHGRGPSPREQAASSSRYRSPAISAGGDSRHEWVIGADGKSRRVKPGIRLLAHGVPARVGKLRAFGNAIDPRPAAAFIQAASEVAP